MTVSQLDALLVDKLHERGQRVTPQRLLIHRALCAREQHLTAEQLLKQVSPSLPGISESIRISKTQSNPTAIPRRYLPGFGEYRCRNTSRPRCLPC